MLEIKKEDKYSIILKFNDEDVESAIEAFEKARDSKEKGVLSCIIVDNKIFKIRHGNSEINKLLVKLGNSSFYKENSNCVLELDEEDLEYGIEMLQKCIDSGFFEVAEFVKVSVSGFKGLVDLYFVKK